MKKLSFFILAIACLSCSRSTEVENGKGFDFSFTIDTVFIDAGDQLIFHQIGLSHSALLTIKNDYSILLPKVSWK